MTTILQLNKAELSDVLSGMFSDMMARATQMAEAKAKDMLLTPDEACDTLKISSVTLWRWQKCGYLIPIYVGGKKRYKSSDIQQIISVGGDKR